MNMHTVMKKEEAISLVDFLRSFGAKAKAIKLADCWLVLEFK